MCWRYHARERPPLASILELLVLLSHPDKAALVLMWGAANNIGITDGRHSSGLGGGDMIDETRGNRLYTTVDPDARMAEDSASRASGHADTWHSQSGTDSMYTNPLFRKSTGDDAMEPQPTGTHGGGGGGHGANPGASLGCPHIPRGCLQVRHHAIATTCHPA